MIRKSNLSVSTVFIFLAIMWMMSPFVSSAHMKLSTEDAKWLTEQCGVDRADVEIIEKLNPITEDELVSSIRARIKKDIVLFKVSRQYFRKWTKFTKGHWEPSPMEGWSIKYLTPQELRWWHDYNHTPPKIGEYLSPEDYRREHQISVP